MNKKEIWASIIGDAKWNDGTPETFEKIIKHFDEKFIIIEREQGTCHVCKHYDTCGLRLDHGNTICDEFEQ